VVNLERWYEYFEWNSKSSLPITCDDLLTRGERERIGKSIAAFQLGEYSEGKGLLKTAEVFANKTRQSYLVRITRLFIAEEQNHALILGRFMTAHQIPLSKKNWTDDVFRALRRPVGFELSVTVLITAEIISLVYYRALKASTGSTELSRICSKILADESMHVAYESQLLNHIRKDHHALHRTAIRLLHTILFAGTTLVVYYAHRPVLKTGGFPLPEFVKACWAEYAKRFFSRNAAEVSVLA